MLLRLKLLMPLLLTTVASTSFALKEIVVLGGGGDEGRETIFDSAYETLMTNATLTPWNKVSVFNGGHSKTNWMIENTAKVKNKTATTSQLNSTINELTTSIQKGSLKKGDQLFLTIASHGLAHSDNSTTHSVATNDGEFNLDSLKKLRDLAEIKGIKLAIYDASCYSGESLKLGSNKTCVVTSAGENVGYNITANEFAKRIRPGANLEEIFLDIRDNLPNIPSTPQISSPAGKKAFDTTKDISRAMMDLDKLKSADKKHTEPFLAQCTHFKKLQSEVQTLAQEAAKAEPLASLRKAIDTYNQKRKSVQSKIEQVHQLGARKCISYSEDWNLCGTLNELETSYNVLSADPKKHSEVDKLKFTAVKKFIKSEEFTKWKNATAGLRGLPTLAPEAERVAAEEKKLYTTLYKKYSQQLKEPNPCKDFVF